MFAVKKIDLGSVALYSFLIGYILTFVFAFIIWSLLSIMPLLTPTMETQMGLFKSMGFLFVIFIPVFYGIVIALTNVILALIYNLLSRYFGGIKVELTQIQK